MFELKVFSPVALVAGLLASFAAPAPADAQQAYAYQNIFDSEDDLTLSGMWNVDNTPAVANSAPGASGGTNLNYNDDVDYDNGAANSGTARTASINLTGVGNATMSFWCRYQTEVESVSSYDQRWIRIFNTTSGAQVYQVQFGTNAAPPANCANFNTWHQHTWTNMPAGTTGIPIAVEFFFNTQDSIGNNFQGWFIDDLVIIADDVTPPQPIDDLEASNPTLSGVTLDWTAPFDDDTSGVAASYDLRFAVAPITEANFAQATQIAGEPTPGPENTPHTVIVSGLNPGTLYYFAIRTTDIAGNTSLISNVASLATLQLPPAGGSATTAAAPAKDRYNACSAGTSAAPLGLLILGGLLTAAGSVRRFVRGKR
jgi:hypothetical protein